mmetsp:Transcript_77031/g.214234  ORF Transcript_77031/g.214234 Transcript_77031/m.214234 type:complete len:220 (-) Transcript_77031:66-725(-)
MRGAIVSAAQLAPWRTSRVGFGKRDIAQMLCANCPGPRAFKRGTRNDHAASDPCLHLKSAKLNIAKWPVSAAWPLSQCSRHALTFSTNLCKSEPLLGMARNACNLRKKAARSAGRKRSAEVAAVRRTEALSKHWRSWTSKSDALTAFARVPWVPLAPRALASSRVSSRRCGRSDATAGRPADDSSRRTRAANQVEVGNAANIDVRGNRPETEAIGKPSR